MIYLQYIGLPHSEIFGSKVICTYPKLIAAYHVLHRLWEPRHPLCALSYFLLSIAFCAYGNAFFDLLSILLFYFHFSSTHVNMHFHFFFSFCKRSNNVSIVVCSSLLTSSNMSKNFSIPGKLSLPYFYGFYFSHGWWWRITESNRWPPACKAGALASWANPPKD